MDTSCCSLSVSGLFQHSSNKGNRPCCKLPFNHDIALASFTGISCDKASFCRTHIITALPVTRTYRPSQTHKKILLQEPLIFFLYEGQGFINCVQGQFQVFFSVSKADIGMMVG